MLFTMESQTFSAGRCTHKTTLQTRREKMNLILHQFGRPNAATVLVVSHCAVALLAEVYQGLLDCQCV